MDLNATLKIFRTSSIIKIFMPKNTKIIERENSTDNGPDPHRKDGAYITKVIPDWEKGNLNWIPLCRHDSDWLGQDAHPHPIYSHSGDRIFFNSRMDKNVNVYAVSARTPE